MDAPDINGTAAERAKTIAFLRDIGLEVIVQPGATGFLEKCQIVDGALHIDEDCPVSNILHEAGHLAVVPHMYRAGLNDDIETYMGEIFENDTRLKPLHPDHPLLRALIEGSDDAATAWAWAAGVAIGLPPDVIIQDDEYESTGSTVRFMLRNNQYSGVHSLQHAGMCVRMSKGAPPSSVARYPVLLKWLQDADLNSPAPQYVLQDQGMNP
jgi:hypothetical protein